MGFLIIVIWRKTMTTNEFIEIISELGYEVLKFSNGASIIKPSEKNIVGDEAGWILFDRMNMMSILVDDSELLEIMVDYASTPIDEREYDYSLDIQSELEMEERINELEVQVELLTGSISQLQGDYLSLSAKLNSLEKEKGNRWFIHQG